MMTNPFSIRYVFFHNLLFIRLPPGLPFHYSIKSTYSFMKRSFLAAAALLVCLVTLGQDNALWMRYPAISPDGDHPV